MIVIDAENIIAGRLASYAAKKALMGEKVAIINCEKAAITGRKKDILAKYERKTKMGHPFAGPFVSRMPDRLIRRIIRGMLPWDRTRGRTAFRRIMCYIGVPEELKNKKTEKMYDNNVSTTKSPNYISLGEISKNLGAKF
ncbi:50S ribosomal protein L13 [Candidatus Woesearchaeota archaeon]|nr:50S ribosomal protein L13 [Candidatus Woesearchaeota archaeon]